MKLELYFYTAMMFCCACAPNVDEAAGAQASGGGAGGAASTVGSGAGGSAPTCPGVDLSSDPKNCGSCGHDCQGGMCVNSACGALELSPPGAVPSLSPIMVAIDSTNVYSAMVYHHRAGGIFAVSREQATLTQLTSISTDSVGALFVTKGVLYWEQDSPPSGVYTMPVDGSAAPSLLFPGGRSPAVDGQFLYGTQAGSSATVYRVPLSGGSPERLGTIDPVGTGIGAIAVDDDMLWLMEAGGVGFVRGSIQTMPKRGGTPDVVLRGIGFEHLSLHDGFVYVEGCESGFCRFATTGGAPDPITVVPTPPPATFVEPNQASASFAVNDTWIHIVGCNTTAPCPTFTEPNLIHRVPVLGGADSPIDPQGFATCVAADDTAVVWANTDGSIWLLAK